MQFSVIYGCSLCGAWLVWLRAATFLTFCRKLKKPKISAGFESVKQEAVGEDGIIAYSTFIGSGGKSTLDYMDSARCIAWSVSPATLEPYSFTGDIKIYDSITGALKGTLYCYSAGEGTTSNVANLSGLRLTSGRNYIARFSGDAVDILENQFFVSSNAKIAFMYR